MSGLHSLKNKHGILKPFGFKQHKLVSNGKHVLPYNDIKTVEINGLRHYIIKNINKTEDDHVLHLPSITTVLGATSDKSGLEEWRKRVGEEEAERISRIARDRGTALHSLLEDYIDNKEIDLSKIDNMLARINFLSAKSYIEKHINNIVLQEAPLYSLKFGIAGRVDCIAEFDGVLSIIDFKTSKDLKSKDWISDYFIQSAFYAVAFFEITGIPISQSVIPIIIDGQKEPQTFIEPTYSWIKELKKVKDLYYATKI